ncbi:hypothetical protein ACIBG6_06850 [Streptomyces sp. NPDC050842]|uniref:hypothetical protein n=1 Tax=Streptomyces sp. NPDC050842 TaxID=3365636 RepID=UPI0037885553
MLPTDEIRALLREYDDPEHLERPKNFDPVAAGKRFAPLVRALETRFGPACSSGLTQDCSHYGGVTVPAEVTGLERPMWVLLSNFGGFVTAGTGGEGMPGSEQGLTEEFLTWLDGVCTETGCVFVPIELLLEPYDGRSVLEQMYAEPLLAALAAEQGWDDDEDDDEDLPPVWFDRYFQYM